MLKSMRKSKNRHFYTSLHSTPLLRGRGVPVGISPPRVELPEGEKKFEDIYAYICFGATHERDGQTDRRTDRHLMTAITALCIASCCKDVVCFFYTALLLF